MVCYFNRQGQTRNKLYARRGFIMDREQNIQNELARIKSDMRELKSKQPIAGDSWVPYRYVVTHTMNPGDPIKYLIFEQDKNISPAAVRVDAVAFSIFSVGRPPVNGKHVFIVGKLEDWQSTTVVTHVLNSSQTGTARVSYQP